MGGDGKIFISVNLGISLVLIGKKVILLGMDLCKFKLVKYLVECLDVDGVGLINFLIGDMELFDVILLINVYLGLYFLLSGFIFFNFVEFLSREKFSVLFE